MGAANKFIAPLTKKIDPVFRKVEQRVGLSKVMPAPAAPTPAQSIDYEGQQRADDKKRAILSAEEEEKRRLGSGRASTMLSGGIGSASTARKSLLGE